MRGCERFSRTNWAINWKRPSVMHNDWRNTLDPTEKVVSLSSAFFGKNSGWPGLPSTGTVYLMVLASPVAACTQTAPSHVLSYARLTKTKRRHSQTAPWYDN